MELYPSNSSTTTSRYEQLIRMLQLIDLVRGRDHCPPIDHLATELGVCGRTVRRYLDAASAAGVPVPPTFYEWEQIEREERQAVRP